MTGFSISDEETGAVQLNVQASSEYVSLSLKLVCACVRACVCQLLSPSSRPPATLFSTGAVHPVGADGAELIWQHLWGQA